MPEIRINNETSSMDLNLLGKIAVVTGASSGIGKCIAVALAREGARVMMSGRDEGRLLSAVGDMGDAGRRPLYHVGDLGEEGRAEGLIESAIEAYGALDILINCASVNVDESHADGEKRRADEVLLGRIQGKLLPAIRCTNAALPHLKKSSNGRVVFIGGTSARQVLGPEVSPLRGDFMPQGIGNSALCNVSKHYSSRFSRYGITFNVIHPHFTRTERHPRRVEKLAVQDGLTLAEAEKQFERANPIGRMIEPDDVATMTVFLASPLCAAITGQSIAVDGGALSTVMY